MTDPILHELAGHQYLRQQLETQFPNADEETLLDTLEGMTNLNEMVTEVVRSRQEDLALVAALRMRLSDMQARLGRLEERADRKKEIVATVMERAGLKKLMQPDFTLSLRLTSPPLVVVDEAQIPDAFWKPQAPKLDRQGLIGALKNGRDVPGATLGNGGMTISVRMK